MKTQGHDNFVEHGQVKAPSNRSFGLTVGGILITISVIRWWVNSPSSKVTAALFIIGVPLVALAIIAPASLSWANRMWAKLGFLLASIVNPIVMFLLFITVFVPMGLVMRMTGRDALRLKRRSNASSHWIERQPSGPQPDGMINQY